MTRLVKAPAAAGLVGPLDLGTRSHAGLPAPAAPQPDALAAARAEIARLERALAAAREAGPKAEAAAREAGRREGHSEAEDDTAQRLAVLEQGVADAAASWAERLSALEPLAALIARAVLLKLVETDAAMEELVTRSVARQMALVRRETVVAIHVSAADFPDDPALARLAADGRTAGVALCADAELEPGACRMDLQLGEVELGVRARWRDAADLLAAIACDASPA